MPSFQFEKTTFDYALKYQADLKDVSISVEWIEGITLTAPEGLSESKLNAILYKKAPWIITKWNELNEISEPPATKGYVSGEKFPYLGRNYRLKVNKG